MKTKVKRLNEIHVYYEKLREGKEYQINYKKLSGRIKNGKI
jgi:hypothetical protein